ncbi:hypothetical protein OIU85_019235 [Salix viminalis]|uniref:Uncharacterized protein n=1 Tax=Salix viminalis TaxID=40686 RepID=A0A9Q0UVE3_SALVM|nr:hypothetical protein OIU85_019235 [Salix viminalis]
MKRLGLKSHKPPSSLRDHISFVVVVKGGKNQLKFGEPDNDNITPEQPNSNLVFEVDDDSNIEWLSRSAGAYARSPEVILNLHDFFSMDGVSCYSPRTMGGNADLHTFHSVNLMRDRLVRCVIGSSKWFAVILTVGA